MELRDDSMCFVCGSENPIGLRLPFTLDGDDCVLEFVPEKAHEGWGEVMHGGLIGTLLDEAMTRICWEKGFPAVTAQMQMRFKKPVQIGSRTITRGRIDECRGRLLNCSAEMALTDGTIVATATGKLMVQSEKAQ
ncbi:MAG: PaaI family thioesterase [Armatimonadota bacterium]